MSSVQVNCNVDHNEFCFVCGFWFSCEKKRIISTHKFMEAYKKQFNCDVADRNVQWSPSVCCNNCHRRLQDEQKPIKYSSPVIWSEPKNHPEDCYFCKTVIPVGRNKNRPRWVKYPDPSTVSIVNAVIQKNACGISIPKICITRLIHGRKEQSLVSLENTML